MSCWLSEADDVNVKFLTLLEMYAIYSNVYSYIKSSERACTISNNYHVKEIYSVNAVLTSSLRVIVQRQKSIVFKVSQSGIQLRTKEQYRNETGNRRLPMSRSVSGSPAEMKI